MKKLLALVLALLTVAALSVTAFAAPDPILSPVATEQYIVVVVIDENNPQKIIYNYKEGLPLEQQEVLTFTAPEMMEGNAFSQWVFLKKDGSVAKSGVDYVLVSQSLTQVQIKAVPGNDLIIAVKYEGKEINIEKAKEMFDEPTSPQTGDTVTPVLTFVLLLSLGGAILTKKQLAK